MNTKGFTQLNTDKKGLRSKTENGEAEVFVLPPDLLQKLGIRLGSNQTFPEPQIDAPPKGVTNNSYIRKTDETILETAKLMKKSVFLSPTFIPTVSNISGEVEIAGISDDKVDTGTTFEQGVGLIDTDVTGSDTANNDSILGSIHKNVSDFMSYERNHDMKVAENFSYGETLNTNTMSFSEINELSHSGNIESSSSYEHFETIENLSLGCCNPNKNVSNNTVESNIEINIDPSQEKYANKHFENHIQENTSLKYPVVTLLDTYTPSINENNLNIPVTNSFIKREHKSPIKINVISEEILDSTKLKELKSLNSPKRATLTPVTVKTVINGSKINENNSMENIDGTYLKDEVNEEIEFLKETDFTYLSKDSPNVKLPINLNLSNMHSHPRRNSSNNIIIPIGYKGTDFKSTNNDIVTSEDGIIGDMSHINMEKETLYRFESGSDSNKILNLYEIQNVDNENEKIKTYFDNECVETFDITSFKQNVNKSIDHEYITTTINIECVDYQNTYDRELHNLITQDKIETVGTLDNNPILYKSNGCENALDNKKNSNIFFNTEDIGMHSGMDHHISSLVEHVIENDKDIKNIFPLIIVKEPATNPDVSSINSKSCIQGVEKPGGNQDNIDFHYDIPKVLQTYKNRKKFKHPLTETSDCVGSKDVLKISESIDQELNNVIATDSIQIQKFCVCDDFGQLGFYENDNLYEHIHFWKHNISKNSEHNIQDDGIKNCNKLEEQQSHGSCVSQQNFDNICWNNYEIDLQEHITKLDVNIDNVHTSKCCDTNETMKENKDHLLNYEIIDIGNDKIYKKQEINKIWTENQAEIKKSSETIHINCKKPSDTVNKIQSINKELSIDVCEARISEYNNIENTKSTTNLTIQCGICMKQLSEIEWEDHISNVHCCIAWKIGDSIELDDTQLLYKLNQKLNSEGVLKCTFCDTKFKELKLLIQHLKACMESLKFNTDDESSKIKKYTKCGVCQNNVETTKWINHIADKHNYMAWNDLECTLDLHNQDKVREHLYKINKQCNGLICSKCKGIYKYVNLYLKHIKKCEGTENRDVDFKNDDHLVALAKSPTTHNSVSKADSISPFKKKNNSKSAFKEINKETDKIMFKDGYNKNSLNGNQYTTDKERPIKNCDGVAIETKMKKEGLPINMSDGDKSRSLNNIVKVSKCETNDINKEPYVKQSKRKSGCISEILLSVSNDDKTQIGKKKKVSKETAESSISKRNVKCGVCLQDVKSSLWFEHISKEHNYLAWVDGKPRIDLNEEYDVERHLRKMLKKYGELICKKCGCKRKYVTPYMSHIKSCENLPNAYNDLDNTTADNRISETNTDLNMTALSENSDERDINCGVCNQEMKSRDWLNHLQKSHNYIAWIEGEKALNTTDVEEVQKHLMSISKRIGGLTCSKCGLVRKYIKSYLDHVRSCELTSTDTSDTSLIKNEATTVQCGVCSEEMEWDKRKHDATSKHNNAAWLVGDPPADIKDTSINEPRHLNTSFESNVTKGRFRNKKKFETLEKESDTIGEVSSTISTTNKTHDQELPQQNQSIEYDSQSVNARNSEEADIISKNRDINSNSSDNVIEITISPIVENYAFEDVSTPLSKMQKTNSKRNTKSAAKETNEEIDGINFENECGITCLDTNQYINNYKKESIKNSHGIKIETEIKTTKKQARNMTDQDNGRSSGISVKENCKNSNNGLVIKQSKRRSDCISKASISASNKDESLKIMTEKKNKVSNESTSTEETNASSISTQNIRCGVCFQEIEASLWFDHISKEHNYLAWQYGIQPIDLSVEFEVEQHLKNILKEYGELICMKCGRKRKYVKPYMSHIKSCQFPNNDSELNDSTFDSYVSEANGTLNLSSLNEGSDERNINCGVCHQEMKSRDWLNHIQKTHNYIAWIEGEKVLDINDPEEVQSHLMSISKRIGGLTCSKCGLVRKYIKTFLDHVTVCAQGSSDTDDSDAPLRKNEGPVVQCGVCSQEMEQSKWKHHAMNKHYNVAWIVGDTPIDLKHFYAVERYLKDYKNKYNKLVCKVCHIKRVSCYGFYAHILFCGKTEEETEKYKELCEICNNKYICIYKHQHMATHREQEFARERKLKLIEENKKRQSDTSNTDTPGRRRAAEKAKIVIEKYKANLTEGNNTCKKCGLEIDKEGDLSEHICSETKDYCPSDSDDSVKLEQCSEEESVDTDVDSNVSNDEMFVEKKKKKHGDSNSTNAKVVRLPYSVKHVGAYINKSYTDFCQTHLTSDVLFPQWRRSDYEVVSDAEIPKYMPPLKESCKVKFISNEWNIYYRFEASMTGDNHIAFVGGTIQCIAWAPSRVDDVDDICSNYLAVGSFSDTECPLYNCDESFHHSNLIQIWDFGNTVTSVPKFEFGIAHDYGTVWAMDWCPSGVRDFPVEKTEDCELQKCNRLGLLATACSNGSVYIFSVPYPSTTAQKEKPFYRMKPVAELRLSMNGSRTNCQATSLSWSSQKGHTIIVVGYSDGLIAFYDLTGDSPFLTRIENDITIIHPYHDERAQNTCITGVSMYMGSGSAWSSASCIGARAVNGLPGRTAVVHTTLASTAASFTPHWPSVQLTGDSYLSSLNQTINELDWVGVGRRMGGARSWCTCARCGLAAATAPPIIRVLRTHPAYGEIRKQVVGVLEMSSIGQKRKQTNDELAIKLEPFNYEGAVKKYGLEFKLIPAKNKAAQQKASVMPSIAYPERYPLADITCMAFCPSANWHNKLAIGIQAGIILFIDV